jgi:protein-S-isoprenylcysteine O-methyltransferase Ste14
MAIRFGGAMNTRTMEFAALPAVSRFIPSRATVLDIFERTFVIGLFLSFASDNLGKVLLTLDPRAAMLVISETLPICLIALRSISPNLSQKPFDWCVGLLGSALPLLISVDTVMRPILPFGVCCAIVTAGFFIQISAKVSLGRSFGIVAANRGVKFHGPYRFVRHPMYLGYMVSHIGFFLVIPSLHNAMFYLLAIVVQLVRIFREEAVLSQDARYRAFASRVPYRLLPGIF